MGEKSGDGTVMPCGRLGARVLYCRSGIQATALKDGSNHGSHMCQHEMMAAVSTVARGPKRRQWCPNANAKGSWRMDLS